MSAPSWQLERLQAIGVGRESSPKQAVRGTPLPLLLAVVLLAGLVTVAQPVTASKESEAVVWTPKTLPASSTAELDPISPLSIAGRPQSPEPVGGIAFVRCTRLWRALPDGSDTRLVLDMKGISSPTFAPDARTIAFRNGKELWMTGADGSRTKMVGSFTAKGDSLPATRALRLTWSPNGKMLGFALVTAGHDLWSGGASLWKLDLATGSFEREGFGWPVPAWQKSRLSYSSWEESGPRLNVRDRRINKGLKDEGVPLAAGFNSGGWTGIYGRGVIALLSVDNKVVLHYRSHPWSNKKAFIAEAPPGYRLSDRSGPVVSQDGLAIYVDLIDPGGGADLGMLDVRSRTWKIIDYAWGADVSPAPSVTGSLRATRAKNAATDLLIALDHGGMKARFLLDGKTDDDLLPFRGYFGSVVHTPNKVGDEWLVPAIAYGRTTGGFAYRELEVRVRSADGRLTTLPMAKSPLTFVRTLEDAASLLRRALPGMQISVPAGLPAGTVLASRYPVDAYMWRNTGSGSINLATPQAKNPGYGDLHFSFGNVSFQLGCGEPEITEPEDLDGTPAMVGRTGRTKQVLWPATPQNQEDAELTVYGELPKDELIEIARATDAAR
jgi:hypothetical protein